MLFASLAVLLPLVVFPQQDNMRLQCGGREVAEADLSQGANDIVRCEDGVVTYQDIQVTADWIELNPATAEVTAGDRVHFTRGVEDLRGGYLSFNLKTKTGKFRDARGQIDGWYVHAGEYERLPNGKWLLLKPTTTACVGDCPRWRFTASESTVTPGERFTAKNMVFRFFNVPLLYLPRFGMPTATKQRSSGFLIPNTATSTSKGRSIQEAFFWAINRSYDATITGEYLSKRGPLVNVDFRGAPNASTLFEVSTLFAADRLGHGGYRSNIRAFSGFDNWRGVAIVDLTSDFDFRQNYEESFSGISNPIEQSMVFATSNRERLSLNAFFNRTGVFYQDAPSTVLWKLPAFEVQRPTMPISSRFPVYFSFDGSVAGVARRDSEIRTPAIVERTDIHPSVLIPVLRSSLLTWSHQIGARETFYTHSIENGVRGKVLNRSLFDYTMKLTGPQVERIFGNGKWKHIVEPTLEYRFVTGVGEDFRKTIIIDENDLVTDTNEIEYGITNRFMAGYEFLTWRVAQKLYFDPTFGGALVAGRRNTLEPLMDLTGVAFSSGTPRRFSPIVSTVRIATTPQTTTDIEVDYDTGREEFTSAGILGGIARGLVGSSVGYYFNKRNEIQPASNQLRGLVTYGSRGRLGVNAAFGFYYDIHNSVFQGSTSQVSYNRECYGISVEYTQYNLGTRNESRLRFSLSLKNLGSIGTLSPQERLF